MFDQTEQSFCGLSAALADSRQDNGGVLFCAVTAVSDCFIKRCQRLLYQTLSAVDLSNAGRRVWVRHQSRGW